MAVKGTTKTAAKSATKTTAKATAKKAKGLGKGLDSLIPQGTVKIEVEEAAKEGGSEKVVSITKVEPNREQPRKYFNEDAIEELAVSIKQHGVVQPILVQDCKDHYEIIAGERRWRAARVAGLKEIPVLIKNLSKEEIMEISLIENIQREDLNPIEEANAYKKLMEVEGLTQDKLAEKVGKKRTTIANSMRLLNLCEEVQTMLVEGKLTSGHARALLTIDDKEVQLKVAKTVADEGYTVRDIEKLVKEMTKPGASNTKFKPAKGVMDIIYREMQDNLRAVIGAKVNVIPKDDEKGKIEIEYYSRDEFDIISNMLLHANDDK